MTTTTQSLSQSQSPSTSNEMEPLERFRPEMAAIPSSEVMTPRVDLTTAATVAIGAMPHIEMHRGELVARFGERATHALDRVVPTAMALLSADADHSAAATIDLEPKATELRARRDRLAAAASALVERGVAQKKALAKLNGGSSYNALIQDTLTLISWFRSQAAVIAAHSVVTAEELAADKRATEAFATDLGRRSMPEPSTAETRARAFTLFFRTYDEVGKMISWLRWHEGDADEIAPTIYVRKRARHDDDAVTPITPTGTPVPPTSTPVAPGMPGGNPFQS